MKWVAATLLGLTLWSSAAAWADEVHLRNGKVMEADRIEVKGDKLLLITEYITIEVLKADVERIVTKPMVAPAAETPGANPGTAEKSITEGKPHCAPPTIPENGDEVRTADDEDLERLSGPDGDPRVQEIQRLEEVGDPKGISILLRHVEDPSAPVHRAALRALGAFEGKDVLMVLLRLVDSPETTRNRGAREGVQRWCERKRTEGSQPLQTAMQEIDPAYGARLLMRAAQFDFAWARPVIFYGLEWGRAEVRLASLISLRNARDPELAPRLPVALSDADWSIRREAAEACGEMGCATGIGKLIDLLRDPEKRVVQAAHRSLVKLTGMEIPADEREWREWWKEARGW